TLALSPGELYDRNLTYAAGRCPARRILPGALEAAAHDAQLLAELITHRLPLAEGVDAYRRLAAREAGWGKGVMRGRSGTPGVLPGRWPGRSSEDTGHLTIRSALIGAARGCDSGFARRIGAKWMPRRTTPGRLLEARHPEE